MGSTSSPTSKLPFHSPLFLQLPTELKIQILNNVDIKDVLSLRFMSRNWADICAPQLFRDGFSLRPHLEDMKRLQEVCSHPDFARGIKHLEIYVGDIDQKHFTHALKIAMTYYHLSTSHFKSLSILIERLFFDSAVMHCERKLLEQAFPLLPNLQSITASSLKYPFARFITAPAKQGVSPFGFLNEVWDSLGDFSDASPGPHFLDTKLSNQRYIDIILASSKLKSPLRNLVLDALCLDTFLLAPNTNTDLPMLRGSEISKSLSIDVHKLAQIEKLFARVETLRMGLRGATDSYYSNLHLAESIGNFFGSMSQLQSLDVALRFNAQIVEAEFRDTWARTFCSNHFPHLEDLRLSQTKCVVDEFTSFILRHAPTLKKLRMDNTTVQRDTFAAPTDAPGSVTSWRDLFTEFRNGLPHLQCFEWLENKLYPRRIYDENWNLIAVAQDKPVPGTLLLEFYVLGKCPWPMVSDNPLGWRGWKSKFMVSSIDFLNYTTDELEDFLANDWETDSDSESNSDESLTNVAVPTNLPDLNPLAIT